MAEPIGGPTDGVNILQQHSPQRGKGNAGLTASGKPLPIAEGGAAVEEKFPVANSDIRDKLKEKDPEAARQNLISQFIKEIPVVPDSEAPEPASEDVVAVPVSQAEGRQGLNGQEEGGGRGINVSLLA